MINPTATLTIGGPTLDMSNFGNTILTASNTNLGINNSTPTETLSIGGPTLSMINYGKSTITASNSNIGINISDPTSTLTIGGPSLEFSNFGNTTLFASNSYLGVNCLNPQQSLCVGGNISLCNYGINSILYSSNGFLGINMPLPTETLSVGGTFSLSNFGKVVISTSNNFVGIGADSKASLSVVDTFSMSNYGLTMLYASNTNLGINVQNPSQSLTVGGSIGLVNTGTTILSPYLTNLGINVTNPSENLAIGNSFSMSNEGTKVMLIASNSSLGINNSKPTETLSIGGNFSLSNYGKSVLTASNKFIGINIPIPTSTLSIGGETITMSNYGITTFTASNNNLGINMIDPEETLSIAGSTFSMSNFGKTILYSSNGYLGIGQPIPTFTLDILGDLNVSGALYSGGASLIQWINTDSNIYYGNGTVGIGTATPSTLLHVSGDVTTRNILPEASGTYDIGASNNTFRDLYLTGATIHLGDTKISKLNSSNIAFQDSNYVLKTLVVNQIQLGQSNDPTDSNVYLIQKSAGGIVFTNITNGVNNPTPTTLLENLYQNGLNFGLGVQNPNESLALLSNLSMSNYGKIVVFSSNSYLGIGISNPVAVIDVAGTGRISGNVGIGTIPGSEKLTVAGDITLCNSGAVILSTSNNYFGINITKPTEILTVGGNIALSNFGTNFIATSNNFIGIGTSNPTQKFTVVGNIGLSNYGTQFIATSNNYFGIGTSNPTQILTVAGNIAMSNYGTQFISTSNNFIGIGTSNPTETLHVLNNTKVDCNLYVLSNIGVGTSNPQFPMDIVGDLNFTGMLRQNGNPFAGSQWTDNSANIYLLDSNIGIGTSTPSEALDINGSNMKVGCNLYVMSNVGIGLSNPNQTLTVAGNIGFSNYGTSGYIGSSNNYIGIGTSVPSQALTVVGNIALNNYGTQFIGTSNTYIGIGTSSPTESLHVLSNMKVGCNLYVMSNIGVGKSNPLYPMDITGDLNFTGTLRQGGTPYIGSQWSNNSTNVFLLGSNVGISTSTPSEALDIVGSNMKVGCNLYVMSNIGIGLSNPTQKLMVAGNIGFSNYGNSGYIGSSNSFIGIGTSVPTQKFTVVGNIGLSNYGNSFIATSNNYFGIGTSNPTESLEVLTNAKIGCNLYVMSNVGIGTSNPQAQLHLSSNLRVDGALSVYSSIQFTGFELIPGQIQNNYTQLYASTSNIQGYSNMVYGASGSNGTMLSIMSNTVNDKFRFVSGAASNDIFTIYGNGNVGMNGLVSINGNSNTLPSTSGSSNNLMDFYTNDGNGTHLQLSHNRIYTGTTWYSAQTILQKKVDATYLGYIAFSDSNDGGSVILGSGNTQYFRIGGATSGGHMTGYGQLMLPNTSGGKVFNFNKLISASATLWYKLATVSDNKGSFNIKGTVSTVHDYHKIDVSTTSINTSAEIATNIIWNKVYYASGLHLWGYLDFVVIVDMTNEKTHLYMKVAPTNIVGVNFDIMCQEKNQNSATSAVFYPNTFFTLAFASPMTTVLDTSLASAANQYVVSTSVNTKFVQLMDQNGYVGIGTSNPMYPLHVIGNINVSADVNKGYIAYAPDGTHIFSTIRSANDTALSACGALKFYTNATTGPVSGTNVMSITTSGYVGIGTSNPSGTLHINNNSGGVYNLLVSGSNSSGINSFITFSNYGINGNNNASIGLNNFSGDSALQFYNSSTILGTSIAYNFYNSNASVSMLNISANGNVAIGGGVTPTYKLEVNGVNTTIRAVNGADAIITSESTSSGYGYFQSKAGAFTTSLYTTNVNGSFYITTGSAAAAVLLYPNNGAGNVGINTGTPSYTLHVTGNIYATGDILAFSDERQKTNIIKISNALDKINQISGYTFDIINKKETSTIHKSTRYAGVIAQEVEKILPEVIYEDNEGTKSVAYGNMVALLLQGIKELKTENNDLREELNNYKIKFSKLEEILNIKL